MISKLGYWWLVVVIVGPILLAIAFKAGGIGSGGSSEFRECGMGPYKYDC